MESFYIRDFFIEFKMEVVFSPLFSLHLEGAFFNILTINLGMLKMCLPLLLHEWLECMLFFVLSSVQTRVVTFAAQCPPDE